MNFATVGTRAVQKWASSMPANITFSEYLAQGRVAEGAIANWARSIGHTIVPAYEIEIAQGKGPQVFTPDTELIAPDMLCVRGNEIRWFEAKSKSHFTWYRIKQQWETGIDLRHYEHYIKVREHFGWPVWVLFYHPDPTPWQSDLDNGCPRQCPTGLFGNSIKQLQKCESHRSDRWGRSGMVYWAHHDLKRLAATEDVEAAMASTTNPGTTNRCPC